MRFGVADALVRKIDDPIDHCDLTTVPSNLERRMCQSSISAPLPKSGSLQGEIFLLLDP
jgi:hypothetical protein